MEFRFRTSSNRYIELDLGFGKRVITWNVPNPLNHTRVGDTDGLSLPLSLNGGTGSRCFNQWALPNTLTRAAQHPHGGDVQHPHGGDA